MSSLALRARREAFQIEEEGDDVILFFCQGALRALQSVVEDEKNSSARVGMAGGKAKSPTAGRGRAFGFLDEAARERRKKGSTRDHPAACAPIAGT